jgi:glycosyltransferase involved in cell wall biosynthesis
MNHMQIYYVAPSYRSHARVARTYIDIIRSRYRLAANVADADVVMVHREPHNYGDIYRAYPSLRRKYVVAYAVWEATELPEAYKRSIGHVQEVWTCSRYCADVFGKYHPCVTYIPHAIHRSSECDDRDRRLVREMLSYSKEDINFLIITKTRDKRKNLQGLIRMFRHLQQRIPRVRLIVKTSPNESGLPHTEDQVTYLPCWFSDAEINALYEIADIYVSPHHSEGWGLTLSDAMLFRKPVLATGYSGNLEFMNPSNSVLIDYSEENIRPDDCFGLFHEGMKWAYPNEQDAVRKMETLCETHRERATNRMVQRATEEINMFSPAAIADLMHSRLQQIRSRL